MNTEFYRLIGSLKAVVHFIETQKHDPERDERRPREKNETLGADEEIFKKLTVLKETIGQLLDAQARISHAYFDFRRVMSKNSEAFYHAINFLRRKAPEWQVMDEDLLQLIESYQATASNLFFGGDGSGPPPPSSSR
jgi:hypothetical protein